MAPPGNIRFAKSKDAIGRDLDIARARKEFFPDRPDVSDDRALRRMQQADQLASFRGQFTRPVFSGIANLSSAPGSPQNIVSGLVQRSSPNVPTLAQEEMRLARQFGPTFKEIMSDINFAAGQIGRGLAEKGTPMMNIIRGFGQAAQNFVQPIIDSPAVQSGIGFFDDLAQKQRDFNAKLAQLTQAQRRIYDENIIIPGTTPEQAYNKAIGMAMGGIATLQ